MDCIEPYLPFSMFYNDLLSDYIEMDKDYTNYKSAIRIENQGASSSRTNSKAVADTYFSFMSHPFILTPATKTLGLFYDNRIRMFSERRISLLQTMTGQSPNPYLKLQVRRDHLIEDTLIRVSRTGSFLALFLYKFCYCNEQICSFDSWKLYLSKILKISKSSWWLNSKVNKEWTKVAFLKNFFNW